MSLSGVDSSLKKAGNIYKKILCWTKFLEKSFYDVYKKCLEAIYYLNYF